MPATPDLFLLLLSKSPADQAVGVAVICIASVLAGFSAYYIGYNIKKIPFDDFSVEP